MRHEQIALQLYTVRSRTAEDLPGTLRAVAAAGYHSVELAGMPTGAWPGLAAQLADNGLRPVASHEGIDGLRADPAAVADRLAAVGCPRVVVPWMPSADRATVDDVRRFAAELGVLSDFFAERGFAFGYHNHDFEFAPLDGTTAWEVLVDDLSPAVQLEVDVYWVSLGGRDPEAVIRSVAGRVHLLHMKDRQDDPEPHDAPAGEGTLDFPGIVAAGRDVGVEWYIAEQDQPVDALAAAESAARYLGSLAG